MVSYNFVFEDGDDGDDGKIKAIYKDGQPLSTAVSLEMPQAIVQTYFKSAFRDYRAMTANAEDKDDNRHHGLQSFLMSLTGLEAFLNVHFHMVGMEKGLPDVVAKATNDKVLNNKRFKIHVTDKIKNLSFSCYGKGPIGGSTLNKKISELYNLRSEIVHPKWEPADLDLGGILINGMSNNFQQVFEDREFCLQALRWCLLVVARIGLLNNPETANLFMKRWTTFYETNATLSKVLGIPEND
jgi:hypothetical protein